VSAPQTSFFEELFSAVRGVVALAIGDRKAPGWFDFSQRGLAGSFIALLAVVGFNAYLPVLLGMDGAEGSVLRSVLTIVLLLAAQIGASALVLRQLNRLDGLVPYLVADNWATFVITLVTLILPLIGLGGEVTLVMIAILVIVVEVNIARLVVTLSAGQIVLLLVGQLVGVMVGLLVIGMLMPLPPELAAQLNDATAATR
jgi:hypothetical protein